MPEIEHKFWATQPVPQSSREAAHGTGAYETHKTVSVPVDPLPLPEGLSWDVIDLGDDEAVEELASFLHTNYIADASNDIAFDYSPDVIRWAAFPRACRKHRDLSVAVRNADGELVGYINGAVCALTVAGSVVQGVKIDFLCVHHSHRAHRLAPLLISEVKRRCNNRGIWQAVYTAATLLPTPVSTARYYHRILDPEAAKRYDFIDDFKPGDFDLRQPPQRLLATTRPYAARDTAHCKALVEADQAAQGVLLAQHYRSKDEFHQAWSNGPSPVHSLVAESEDGEVVGIAGFTVIDHFKRGKDDKPLRIAYLNGAYVSQDGAAREVASRRLELLAALLQYAKEVGVHVFNCLDIENNLSIIRPLGFLPGTGHLHYYVFNFKWGKEKVQPSEIALVLV